MVFLSLAVMSTTSLQLTIIRISHARWQSHQLLVHKSNTRAARCAVLRLTCQVKTSGILKILKVPGYWVKTTKFSTV